MCLLICIKLNHDAKNNRFKSHKKEGAFFVQIVGDKDIVVVKSKPIVNGLENINNIFSAGIQSKNNDKTQSLLVKFNNNKDDNGDIV